jgi:hypothetical protein
MANVFATPELALGIAVGGAAGAAFEPKLEIPKQSAWANNPQRLPDVGLIAALVAGGKVSMASGEDMAARLGFDKGPFHSLTWLAQDRLNFPLMLRLWRRFGAFDAGDDATLSALLDETLAHEQLDWDYQPWLRRLKHAELVGLGDIATGVVRSALPAPSYVPVPAPTSGLSVPRFPQVDIDPEKLAAALGFDKQMLQLMVARSGLSLAPGLAATALFRGEINDKDFLLAIAEGDLRTEWAETLKNASRQIPTADQFVEAWLRGWLTQKEAEDGAALHGMKPAYTDLIHKVKGRPVTFHEITTGLARGGSYPSTYDDIPEPYRKSIQEADIRPEWASLHYANRYLYPSAFVLRSLAQQGDLGGQQAVEQVLLEIGWKPSFATQVSTAWTTQGGAAVDPHVKKAQSSLFTEAHKAYVKVGLSQAQVEPALVALAVPPADQTEIFHLWDVEKQLAAEVPAP